MKKTLLSAGALALGLAALPVSAQSNAERGWYVGGNLGHAKAKNICSIAPAGVSCDDTSVSWGILGGYKFSRNFAGELGWGRIASVGLSGAGTSDVDVNAY